MCNLVLFPAIFLLAFATIVQVGITSSATDTDSTTFTGVPPPAPPLPTLAAAPMFSLTVNRPGVHNPSNINFGQSRLWDSGNLQWPDINVASGTFTFTNLDSTLAAFRTDGATEGFYTLGRAPTWASSDPTDATCAYHRFSYGQCHPPNDLRADGSGTDLIWRNWVAKIAAHVHGQDGNAGYLSTHMHIKYWETCNEVDNSCTLSKKHNGPNCGANFYAGTYDQLQRMTADARCIIVGGTDNGFGETCSHVRSTVKS